MMTVAARRSLVKLEVILLAERRMRSPGVMMTSPVVGSQLAGEHLQESSICPFRLRR
ncbi:MAG: hypothetical protein ACLVB5_03975 [Christensenellales bacterium]